MPIIGRQCTRDGRTVCIRMSEAALPVNQSGPGLTLVYGWASEERRAQGASPAIQGIDFCSNAGKILPLDFCPWCGAKIASSAASVRAHVGAPVTMGETPKPPAQPGSSAGARSEAAAPPEPKSAARAVAEAAPSPPTPPAGSASAPGEATTLKALRERLGLSQAELGEKLGLARSSVANYENGRAPLSQRLRKWMAKHEKKLVERV
jgi:DNA-binding XRE family transcriptional regulator